VWLLIAFGVINSAGDVHVPRVGSQSIQPEEFCQIAGNISDEIKQTVPKPGWKANPPPRFPIMIIETGEKIHVIFSKLFEADFRRHFVGIVEKCEGNLVRAVGCLYSEETKMGHIGTIVKGADMRVRIIPLDCESVIVNILPKRVNIEKIAYKYDIANSTVRVADGSDWHLDLARF
jgi:hypothetical protein